MIEDKNEIKDIPFGLLEALTKNELDIMHRELFKKLKEFEMICDFKQNSWNR
jgi:hypothetical protein